MYEKIEDFCKTKEERAIVQSTPYKLFTVSQQIFLGNAKLTCLGPITYRRHNYKSGGENSNSLVFRLNYGETSYLFTGDATHDELREIAKTYPGSLDADLLKNPHHNAPLNEDVVDKITPTITIFSTSNSARPKPKYTLMLRKLGCEVYSTPSKLNGNILVTSDGKTITVIPQKGDANTTK